MTDSPERICDNCGAPVTQNVHGEVQHVSRADLLAEAVKALGIIRLASNCSSSRDQARATLEKLKSPPQ